MNGFLSKAVSNLQTSTVCDDLTNSTIASKSKFLGDAYPKDLTGYPGDHIHGQRVGLNVSFLFCRYT